MGERAAGVVCQFSEESLRFAFGKGSHFEGGWRYLRKEGEVIFPGGGGNVPKCIKTVYNENICGAGLLITVT